MTNRCWEGGEVLVQIGVVAVFLWRQRCLVAFLLRLKIMMRRRVEMMIIARRRNNGSLV